MIPLWVIRYVLPGVGAVLALWAAYSWADGRGYDRADAKWQAQAAKDAVKIRQIEQQWRDEHAKADAADAARIAAQDALMAALQRKVTVYAQSETGRACGLDADGGLLINEAIGAANRTVASGSSPRR